MEVEREVADLYRALYMRGHVGETFSGKVTAVVGSGVYVQLDSPFIDVLVKSESLGSDRYELDDEAMRMVGQRSGDKIALGDPMDVVIEDVAILRRAVYGRRLGAVAAAEDGRQQRRGPKKPGQRGAVRRGHAKNALARAQPHADKGRKMDRKQKSNKKTKKAPKPKGRKRR